MVKVKVIEDFSLKDFATLKNIKRASEAKSKIGSLYNGDVFECDSTMCAYLTGDNPLNKKVVEIIEVKEEVKAEDPVKEETKEVIEIVPTPKKKKSKKNKK